MNNQHQNETHGVLRSILYHIVPGILAGAVYFLLRHPLKEAGFPSLFALMVAAIAVIVPVELGFLLFQGKKRSGRFTLSGVIGYRQQLPVWQYVVWSLVVFVIIGGIFTVMKPVDGFFQEKLFSWMPGLDSGLEGNYARSHLIITYIALLLVGVIAAPIVEELYFRGYLLPRTPGRLGVLWHSLLFAAYHVFTPWMIVTRTVGLLPLVLVVKKKSIYIGIVVHILLNSIDAVMGFIFIAGMA